MRVDLNNISYNQLRKKWEISKYNARCYHFVFVFGRYKINFFELNFGILNFVLIKLKVILN